MNSKELERLNLELIKVRSSKEYKKGKDTIKIIEMLRRLNFVGLWKKMRNRKKIAKLSCPERDNDFKYDRDRANGKSPRVVVYTCITGGYDKLSEPFIFPENVDYVAFVDEKIESSGWKINDLPIDLDKMSDNAIRNRYIKFHPWEFFMGEYDYAIYIDGNIGVVGDLTSMTYAVNEETGLALHRHRQRNSIYAEAKVCNIVGKGNREKLDEQVEKYMAEGFPDDFGLYECNIIVSSLNNECGRSILEDWWKEYMASQSGRDQIALPYVVWKRGIQFDKIGSLGDNVYRNPKVLVAENIHEK